MLDTVLGLPLHPLVVHAVVVLLPLVALGVMALAVVPRWRARFALPLLGLLVVGAGSAVVAMLSGNELAERVGIPATHQTLGTTLAFSAVGYLVFAGGWLWWVRGEEDDEPSTARDVAGWVAAGLSAAIIALTVLVGHSGATAVWGGVGATPEGSPTPSASAPPSASSSAPASPSTTAEATPSTEPSASPSRIGTPPATNTYVPEEGYTMDMVAEHATADSCWVAVNGFVYDVTDWIPQHPGGPERIIPLCGSDATSAFGTQHGDAALPNQRLSQFLLGPLA
ncbi:DUF2231 domain-containing protein [Tessaracoccus sp. G1721]